jgi:hypothetical protein
MCAAPGSKTAQLIELLHAEDGPLPSMLLVRSARYCAFILFNFVYNLLSGILIV